MSLKIAILILHLLVMLLLISQVAARDLVHPSSINKEAEDMEDATEVGDAKYGGGGGGGGYGGSFPGRGGYGGGFLSRKLSSKDCIYICCSPSFGKRSWEPCYCCSHSAQVAVPQSIQETHN